MDISHGDPLSPSIISTEEPVDISHDDPLSPSIILTVEPVDIIMVIHSCLVLY